jgi:PAS domain S-box-containing protein
MSIAAENTRLEARYRSRLTTYLGREAAEAELAAALELRRMALAEGHGLLDLLGIHQALLGDLIHHSSSVADILLLLNRANEFLTHAAAPFEMAHRGWHDMADRLRLANEVLEQRVAERTTAHREAVERLDRAQQIAGIGSWELDLKTGQQTWSKEMHRICGLGDELPVSASNSIFPFIHDEDRDLHERWFAHLRSGRDPGTVEHRIRLPNGQHRLIRADGQVVKGAEGTVSKICGTLQDITERKAAETQLHELQAELAHFSRLNTIGHMASGLAHELNQPLSAIANYLKGCSRLLSDSPNEQLSPVRHALDKAGAQAMRAGQIVRRLRDFMAHHETDFLIESIKKLVEEAGSLALVGVKEGSRLGSALSPISIASWLTRFKFNKFCSTCCGTPSRRCKRVSNES